MFRDGKNEEDESANKETRIVDTHLFKHCMKQTFPVEHFLTECLISGFITNYIEEKTTMATGKQVSFNPLSTLLNILD